MKTQLLDVLRHRGTPEASELVNPQTTATKADDFLVVAVFKREQLEGYTGYTVYKIYLMI